MIVGVTAWQGPLHGFLETLQTLSPELLTYQVAWRKLMDLPGTEKERKTAAEVALADKASIECGLGFSVEGLGFASSLKLNLLFL